MRAPTLLEIRALSAGFQTARGHVERVLDEVSLEVGSGEIVGLVGESGSGKSLTAKTVLRLFPSGYRTCGGNILFGGVDLLGLDREAMRRIRGRRIAYVAQEPMNALNPTARVGNQLAMVLREHFGTSRSEARARSAAILEQMHITDPERILDAYPFALSGGLRQRVALANAFLCQPELLIADEPTTALDVTVQAEVLAILSERARATAASVLFITHNMGIVWRLCDRTYVMRRGAIVEEGLTRTVLSQPSSAYTAALLRALPERNPPRTMIAAGA